MTQKKLIHLDHLKLDISGPKGNAFVILGIAQDYFKQCGVDKAEVDAFMAEAKSDSFDHLCETFTAATGIRCYARPPTPSEWI